MTSENPQYDSVNPHDLVIYYVTATAFNFDAVIVPFNYIEFAQ